MKKTKSKPRRMLWARPALGMVRLSLGTARPVWRCFGLSALLHGTMVAVVIAWTPKVIEVVRTYEVELVTVRPVVTLKAEPPVPAAKKAEPQAKPPEPRKEAPPSNPEPVAAMAVAKRSLLPHMPAPTSVIQSPLRVAVTSAPVPTPVAVESSATNAALSTAVGNGTEEVSDPAYLNTVRAAVARQLRYPELALRRGVEGRVVLRLTLDAAGRLLDSAAGAPGDDAALRSAALAAVKRAAPFPPWEGAHDPAATLNLTLPIRFKFEDR